MDQASWIQQAQKRARDPETTATNGLRTSRTAEERARVKAIYDEFCRQHAAITGASSVHTEVTDDAVQRRKNERW